MIVGIDLGTTNSLVGFWRDGAATLIPNALGHFLTPSAVGMSDDGEILVGLSARERLVTHPSHTAATFKRYMGTDRVVSLGRKAFRAEELSALVLRSLNADAEAFLAGTVDEAIITVPAYFNDTQRKATKAAGELAGLTVKRLLTEPTAAALAYGLETVGQDSTILVVDLGGGTFDVSVLQCFEGVMEVRAAAGDSWLGGEDFIDAIVAAFMAGPGRDAGLPPASAAAPIHGALRRQAELAKRKLSDADEAVIELAHDGKALTWSLTRDTFEKISEPLLARLRAPIEVIERNTVIPTSRSKIISTIADNQTKVEVKIYQGESRMVQDNVLLGELKMRVPRAPAGRESLEIRFTYDTSGLLEVEATVRSTGHKETVVIEGNPGVLSPQEIKQRLGKLSQLKVHPRDEAPNSAIVARAKRLYEERLGAARDEIGSWLAQFMGVLERQEPREIAPARERFAELLDSIDNNFL
jgi:molecular chaperone DnaK (HSP70)